MKDFLKLLLDNGADINKYSSKGFTAMHIAVLTKGHWIPSFLELFLKNGADFSKTDCNGTTPYALAKEINATSLFDFFEKLQKSKVNKQANEKK